MFDGDSDFGYFGKGFSGYSHYMQSFNSNFANKNNSGKIKPIEQKSDEKPSEIEPQQSDGTCPESLKYGLQAITAHLELYDICLEMEPILSAKETLRYVKITLKEYEKYYIKTQKDFPMMLDELESKHKQIIELQDRCISKIAESGDFKTK